VVYAVRPLAADNWPAFARLVEANNGVWGGCWCMGFHVKLNERTPAENRAEKEKRVREGRAHAALVMDGDECLGWCQFGSPAELPEIKSRRRYEKDLTALPDWRITCFFTGKGLRGREVADAALGGALNQIARYGGGIVEGYPEETDNRRWQDRSCIPGRWPRSRITDSPELGRYRRIGGWSRAASIRHRVPDRHPRCQCSLRASTGL
jgi:hypothetical protein